MKNIVPYYMFSYPDYKTSLKLFKNLTHLCDTIEIGFPFSDPLADGPVIQAAANEVITKHNPDFKSYFKFINEIHLYNKKIKLFCMTYLNPILYYGLEKFLSAAAKAGLTGFIIPDLPPEEADIFLKLSNKYKLKVSFIITPLTEKKRIDYISKITTGFIYYVTYTGVTGKKAVMSKNNIQLINYIKNNYQQKIYIGFGIKTKSDVKNMLKYADKVIIGSALLNIFNKTQNIDKICEYLNKLQ